MHFDTELLVQTREDLAGENCVIPINITKMTLFTDSLVSLSWLKAHSFNYGKMNKISVFVMNRLNAIAKLCSVAPIGYAHCAGVDNPADTVTRCLSHKLLLRSSFLNGPPYAADDITQEITVIPYIEQIEKTIQVQPSEVVVNGPSIFKISDFSCYRRLVNVTTSVLTYINNIKKRIKNKNIDFKPEVHSIEELRRKAHILTIKNEQAVYFGDAIEFFDTQPKYSKAPPSLVSQLNLFRDENGLLRVKCKLSNKYKKINSAIPILLPKNSHLTKIIINDMHKKLNHSGKYVTISEIRKTFYIPNYFSVVKKCLKQCITCSRYNNRTIKVNQGDYREFRATPPSQPFSGQTRRYSSRRAKYKAAL